MRKTILKSLVLGSLLLTPALQAATSPKCPEKAFSALWDGLIWTVVTLTNFLTFTDTRVLAAQMSVS